MVFGTKTYSVLVVSSSEKFDEAIRPMFIENGYYPIAYARNISAAKRALLENQYDIIIINSPLPDDIGLKFAIDASSGKNSVCLILLKNEHYDSIYYQASENGVFTLQKPTSSAMMSQALKWMISARERLGTGPSDNLSIEEKMEEIRLVNRAKWMLISKMGYSEEEAHKYIEKQSMERCVSKKVVASGIIGEK